ncbi:hypothetical protein M3Y99_01028200 [Aphelenchoides fujianensis]|nr:hypothetical protein M3Y99_01028200 [Aphelenchoides fujianensis]
MFSYSPFHSSPFSSKHADSPAGPELDVGLLDILANFYVICPKLVKREDEEHKRLLFYYPPEETSQRKVTGMAAAIVNFTSELVKIEGTNGTKRRAHRFVCSNKTAAIFLPVEEDFILGATFNRGGSFFAHSGTLLRTVENLYEMYRLFHGPFKRSFQVGDSSAKELAFKLDTFFSNYLLTMKLSSIPLIDYLDGVCFMPLDQKLFLETQCFVDELQEECAELRLAMFLFQTRLAQYSVQKSALRPLYRFLVEHLIPHALAEELQPEIVSLSSSGRFVQAYFDFAPQDGPYPRVQLENEESGELEVAYRSLNATLCVLVPEEADVTRALTKLRQRLEPKMSALASAMGETISALSRPLISTVPFHFIYFNYDSLSFRTSLKQQPNSSGATSIAFTAEINHAIYEAFDKFVERLDEGVHQALKVGGDLAATSGSSSCSSRTPANSSLQDFHGHFNSILAAHFTHVHFD